MSQALYLLVCDAHITSSASASVDCTCLTRHMEGLPAMKHVKNLYVENYKTLPKEIKDLNKWNDIQSLWTGRLDIKM